MEFTFEVFDFHRITQLLETLGYPILEMEDVFHLNPKAILTEKVKRDKKTRIKKSFSFEDDELLSSFLLALYDHKKERNTFIKGENSYTFKPKT